MDYYGSSTNILMVYKFVLSTDDKPKRHCIFLCLWASTRPLRCLHKYIDMTGNERFFIIWFLCCYPCAVSRTIDANRQFGKWVYTLSRDYMVRPQRNLWKSFTWIERMEGKQPEGRRRNLIVDDTKKGRTYTEIKRTAKDRGETWEENVMRTLLSADFSWVTVRVV